MHGSQGCYGEHVKLTADDIWQIADVGDREVLSHETAQLFEIGDRILQMKGAKVTTAR